MKYNIRCRVSGGVTGTRTSKLKQDGNVQEFETLEIAQAECDKLLAGVSRHAVATFEYWPIPAEGEAAA